MKQQQKTIQINIQSLGEGYRAPKEILYIWKWRGPVPLEGGIKSENANKIAKRQY